MENVQRAILKNVGWYHFDRGNKRQSVNFVIVAIIYVLHQMSAQYKNINNTKLDKTIWGDYNKICDNDIACIGTNAFLGQIVSDEFSLMRLLSGCLSE